MKATVYLSPSFFSSFRLQGMVQPDGTLVSPTGETLPGWPEQLEFEGITYILDEIVDDYWDPKPDEPCQRSATYTRLEEMRERTGRSTSPYAKGTS